MIPTHQHPPDIYIASFADVNRWGGGASAANGLAQACLQRQLRTTILGVGHNHHTSPATPQDRHAQRLNLPLRNPRGTWRIQSWRTTGMLAHHLRRMPPPRRAFIANSMYWAVAAKRAWPRTPNVYRFPCLLTNCLPFTWAGHRPPGLWSRLNFAGITRAEHRAFALADLTLVPTHANLEEITRFHPDVANRTLRCDFGCQIHPLSEANRAYHRRQLGLNSNNLLVLAAGVCDRNKAFEWAIHELEATNPNIHLAIVGDGPQFKRLQKLQHALALNQRVHLVGAQSNMAPWYAAADVVLSTSWYDAFPNVIREAMAAGRTVVVPRHDPPAVYAGIAEIVAESAAGLTYDRRTRGALAKTLNSLAHDLPQLLTTARRARQYATRHFNWNNCLDQILTLQTTI